MNQVSMLINGERTMARDGATFERRNPLDDTVASTAPAASLSPTALAKPAPPPCAWPACRPAKE